MLRPALQCSWAYQEGSATGDGSTWHEGNDPTGLWKNMCVLKAIVLNRQDRVCCDFYPTYGDGPFDCGSTECLKPPKVEWPPQSYSCCA